MFNKRVPTWPRGHQQMVPIIPNMTPTDQGLFEGLHVTRTRSGYVESNSIPIQGVTELVRYSLCHFGEPYLSTVVLFIDFSFQNLYKHLIVS